MSKFPLYNTTKSREMFNRASQVIPGGIYGHLGPAEGQWIPVNRWPSFAEKAQGSYFWDVDGNKYIDYMCALDLTFLVTTTLTLTQLLLSS